MGGKAGALGALSRDNEALKLSLSFRTLPTPMHSGDQMPAAGLWRSPNQQRVNPIQDTGAPPLDGWLLSAASSSEPCWGLTSGHENPSELPLKLPEDFLILAVSYRERATKGHPFSLWPSPRLCSEGRMF